MKVAPSSSRPEFTHEFKYQGRSYRLYKREKTPAGNYYIDLTKRKKRNRQSLDTNQLQVAVDRAKGYIRDVLEEAWDGVRLAKLRTPCATFEQIFEVYRKAALIDPHSIQNNIGCVRLLFTKQGLEFSDKHAISLLTDSLVASYQSAVVKAYCSTADDREARERALRTSRSVVFQARSLFNRDKELPRRYAEAGLKIPDSIAAFMTCKVQGKSVKREYLAPMDSVVEKAFKDVDKLKATDPVSFIAFWFAVGAGLRRTEIHRMRWEHLIERDGVTWVSGGIGKDGSKIEVPMQSLAVKRLDQFRKPSGRVVGELKSLEWAKRLNWWMTTQGWATEKKMHELRAYVGSLLYQRNPLLAMKFLRHKTLKMTETFYVRYGRPLKPVDVLGPQ